MNETKFKSEEPQEKEHSKSQGGLKKITCIGEESYLKDLMLNSMSIQRMQDFIRNLD